LKAVPFTLTNLVNKFRGCLHFFLDTSPFLLFLPKF
jgi:hypothetical protein